MNISDGHGGLLVGNTIQKFQKRLEKKTVSDDEHVTKFLEHEKELELFLRAESDRPLHLLAISSTHFLRTYCNLLQFDRMLSLPWDCGNYWCQRRAARRVSSNDGGNSYAAAGLSSALEACALVGLSFFRPLAVPIPFRIQNSSRRVLTSTPNQYTSMIQRSLISSS